jgi:hypothetical protein
MVMGLLLAVFFEINASRKWDKISVYPNEQRLRDFCLSSDIEATKKIEGLYFNK